MFHGVLHLLSDGRDRDSGHIQAVLRVDKVVLRSTLYRLRQKLGYLERIGNAYRLTEEGRKFLNGLPSADGKPRLITFDPALRNQGQFFSYKAGPALSVRPGLGISSLEYI